MICTGNCFEYHTFNFPITPNRIVTMNNNRNDINVIRKGHCLECLSYRYPPSLLMSNIPREPIKLKAPNSVPLDSFLAVLLNNVILYMKLIVDGNTSRNRLIYVVRAPVYPMYRSQSSLTENIIII